MKQTLAKIEFRDSDISAVGPPPPHSFQMSAFARGTLFRSYNADRTAHSTAVLLKDGTMQELKNADGSEKKIYPSYEAWASEKGAAAVEIDTSKATGTLLTTDARGFNVDLTIDYNGASPWFQWLFRMMAEIAPHLLANHTVKDAFNALVAVCAKHKGFGMRVSSHNKIHYYDPAGLSYNPEKPASFGWFQEDWLGDKYMAEKAEIGAIYKVFYELVAADLHPTMQKKHELINVKHMIKWRNIHIRRYESRIRVLRTRQQKLKSRFGDRMDYLESRIQWHTEDKAKSEEDLRQAEERLAMISD
jgi:hypothetical protein